MCTFRRAGLPKILVAGLRIGPAIAACVEIVLFGMSVLFNMAPLGALVYSPVEPLGPMDFSGFFVGVWLFVASQLLSWVFRRERLWVVVVQTAVFAFFSWSMFWWYKEVTVLHPSFYWTEFPS